jgi:hypothetical protein
VKFSHLLLEVLLFLQIQHELELQVVIRGEIVRRDTVGPELVRLPGRILLILDHLRRKVRLHVALHCNWEIRLHVWRMAHHGLTPVEILGHWVLHSYRPHVWPGNLLAPDLAELIVYVILRMLSEVSRTGWRCTPDVMIQLSRNEIRLNRLRVEQKGLITVTCMHLSSHLVGLTYHARHALGSLQWLLKVGLIINRGRLNCT